MTPAEQLTAWREELATERAETEQNLAAERSALVAAETAYSEAKSAWAALEGFVTGPLGRWNVVTGEHKIVELTSPLYSRLQDARDDLLKPPESARGNARAAVASLEAQLEVVRGAIGQIDAVLSAAKVTPLLRSVEPSRRKPLPIEFDNIQMPQEAT